MRTKKKSSGKITGKEICCSIQICSSAQTQTFQTASDSQTAEIADAIQTNRGASGSAAYKIS